ncbi:hypothetical protein C8Q76DRAFT_797578 [Earliella scabrosa]|nr:hypothetical protein C8Q76DRAFT_797578 [Earliella scabrosa]
MSSMPQASPADGAFARLTEIQRDIIDTKAKLDADLFEHLDVESGDDIMVWQQQFLRTLLDNNSKYRATALRRLRANAARARTLRLGVDASSGLSRSLQELADLNSMIHREFDQLTGYYERVTPLLSQPQQAVMKAEVDWMQSSFAMVNRIPRIIAKDLEQVKICLQALELPEAQFEALLSPLKRTPPGISSISIDPVSQELYRLWDSRRNAATQSSTIVSSALSKWFTPDSACHEHEQRELVAKMQYLYESMIAQVTKQNALWKTLSLFKERAEHAPSKLGYDRGLRVEIADLFTVLDDYDGAVEEIATIYATESLLLDKVHSMVLELAPLIATYEDILRASTMDAHVEDQMD